MTNSAILRWLDQHLDDRVFVVADGAAFGCYADRVLKLQAFTAILLRFVFPNHSSGFY